MRSPLAYVGGKSRLAGRIASRIPDHDTYVEVFCGAAWVFFTKEPSAYEVLNDISGDIVTFFRVLKHHPEEFARQLENVPYSRAVWKRYLADLGRDDLTDVQRAARFYYVQRGAFSGKVTNRVFGCRPGSAPRVRAAKALASATSAAERLSQATIESLDFTEALVRYDRPRTFFYLDPPYCGRETEYGKHVFRREDYTRLAETLSCMRGRFLMSLNDVPLVKELFAEFRIEPVTITYSAARGGNQAASELFITNFDLQRGS